MSEEFTSLPWAERLNAIHRLRLLRNTTGELSVHTGIQLRNNSFSRKAPFIARCIYSEFCREVQERTGDDLGELMTAYDAASRYFERIAKTRRAQPEFHREVLRCLLDPEFAGSDEAKPYRSFAEAAEELDAAILTLQVLEILPSFQAKTGDVDPNMHLEYLAQLREYFRVLYDGGRLFRFAPYLTEMYRNAMRQILGGELFTRLDLIHFTREIISNLTANYSPESLLQANRHFNRRKIHPDLEQGVWIECDSHEVCPVYWAFKSLGLDYILIRRKFDRAMKRITEIRYELLLFRDESEISFQLLRQSEVERLCMGAPIPEQAYMNGFCRIDNLQLPKRIEWSFATNRYDDFPTGLVRPENGSYDRLVERAAAEGWTVVCETGDYVYLSAERVITTRHIYVECQHSVRETGEREIVSWYRIPREGLLDEVDTLTPIAHIRHDQRTYINFIPMNRSFDVTNAHARATSGIEITEQIVVVASDPE